MKLTVAIKCPGALEQAIVNALEAADTNPADIEFEATRIEGICSKWFNNDECLIVEIDTDKETCTIVKDKS